MKETGSTGSSFSRFPVYFQVDLDPRFLRSLVYPAADVAAPFSG